MNSLWKTLDPHQYYQFFFFQNIGEEFNRINCLYISVMFFLMYNMDLEELDQQKPLDTLVYKVN